MQKSRLRWLTIAGLVTAAIVAVAVLTSGDGASNPSDTTTATTAAHLTGLSEAVDRADLRIEGVSAAEVENLIRELCTSVDADEIARLIVDLEVSEPDDVRAVVEGVGHGAEVYCPEVAAQQPQLVNEAFIATMSLLSPPTTT